MLDNVGQQFPHHPKHKDANIITQGLVLTVVVKVYGDVMPFTCLLREPFHCRNKSQLVENGRAQFRDQRPCVLDGLVNKAADFIYGCFDIYGKVPFRKPSQFDPGKSQVLGDVIVYLRCNAASFPLLGQGQFGSHGPKSLMIYAEPLFCYLAMRNVPCCAEYTDNFSISSSLRLVLEMTDSPIVEGEFVFRALPLQSPLIHVNRHFLTLSCKEMKKRCSDDILWRDTRCNLGRFIGIGNLTRVICFIHNVNHIIQKASEPLLTLTQCPLSPLPYSDVYHVAHDGGSSFILYDGCHHFTPDGLPVLSESSDLILFGDSFSLQPS